MKRVPFFDATRVAPDLRARLHAAATRVIDSGSYILGAEVEAFEREAAQALGVAHAVGVSSGTDALLLALLALGVGPGDEVIVPAFCFIAPAEMVARLGATPRFVDVDSACFCLDPEQVAGAITARTKAVIAAHLFGQSADMAGLRRALEGRSIALIEDGAQAFGVRGEDGAFLGKDGKIGCFSFFPTKLLGGFGDGGLVTTNDAALADRVRLLRGHGARPKYHHLAIGGNFRLDALQAALLREKLAGVGAAIEARRRVASRYDARLAPLAPRLAIPAAVRPHGYHQYVVRVRGDRDGVARELARRGIETQVYYPEPLHTQPCFEALFTGPPPVLSETERACGEVLALPMFPGLREDEVDSVCDALQHVVRSE